MGAKGSLQAVYDARVTFFDKLRAALRPRTDLIPDEPISYIAIGVVRNMVRTSRPGGWEGVRSNIVLREELLPALEAIEGFSHVMVVFHLDQIPGDARRLTVPAGNEEPPPERGVLATRSQLRPNAIGVSVVKVMGRRNNVLRVEGLDALNGTPVLDLKPYLPAYDAVVEATMPSWAERRDD